jgi:hypothetical protein
MEKWLLNADDAPPDHDVWGYKKQTFDNLKGILRAHHEPQLPTKAKGKGGRSDGSSLEIEVVGKGKGKEVHRNVSSSPVPVKKGDKGKKKASRKASTVQNHHAL